MWRRLMTFLRNYVRLPLLRIDNLLYFIDWYLAKLCERLIFTIKCFRLFSECILVNFLQVLILFLLFHILTDLLGFFPSVIFRLLYWTQTLHDFLKNLYHVANGLLWECIFQSNLLDCFVSIYHIFAFFKFFIEMA